MRPAFEIWKEPSYPQSPWFWSERFSPRISSLRLRRLFVNKTWGRSCTPPWINISLSSRRRKKNVTTNKHVMSQHAEMFSKCLCGLNPETVLHCIHGIIIIYYGRSHTCSPLVKLHFWWTHLGITSMVLRLQSLDWILPCSLPFFLTGLSIQSHAGGEQG